MGLYLCGSFPCVSGDGSLVSLFFPYRLEENRFAVGIVALLLTVMTVMFTVKQNNRITEREYGIVMTPSVTVKGAPDDSGTELFVIHEGLKVRIIGSLGDWVNIRLEDGNEGWVVKKTWRRSDYLLPELAKAVKAC